MTHLEAQWREEEREQTFEQFMENALYHAEYGYYQRRHAIFGREGDFTTAPVLGSALGKAIARWIRSEFRNRSGEWHLIETGAGDGSLATAILGSLGFWTRRKIRYHIVEISENLRQRQMQSRFARSIQWHDDIGSALAVTQAPIVLSNEFVDAFPCRILRSNGTDWEELAVANASNGRVGEKWRPYSRTPTRFSALETSWASEGQRIELHQSYADWFQTHFSDKNPCRLLTIDYGDRFPALYNRRPSGTLRAYFRNMRLQGAEVYERPGLQDLTADLNFTDLEHWAREAGFDTQLSSLRDWVDQWDRPSLSSQPRLFSEEGAGGAFQVLVGWR